MKKSILMAVMATALLMVSAKDIKTLVVTTTPVMHCENCENKIKSNLRFEKGMKDIKTDIPSQTVTITYDADKNSAENIIKAFGKIGYEAKEMNGRCRGNCNAVKTDDCCEKANGGVCSQAEGECCKKDTANSCRNAKGNCCKKSAR